MLGNCQGDTPRSNSNEMCPRTSQNHPFRPWQTKQMQACVAPEASFNYCNNVMDTMVAETNGGDSHASTVLLTPMSRHLGMHDTKLCSKVLLEILCSNSCKCLKFRNSACPKIDRQIKLTSGAAWLAWQSLIPIMHAMQMKLKEMMHSLSLTQGQDTSERIILKDIQLNYICQFYTAEQHFGKLSKKHWSPGSLFWFTLHCSRRPIHLLWHDLSVSGARLSQAVTILWTRSPPSPVRY